MDWNKMVFVAHATEDRPRVRKLCADLEASGLDVWLDERRLLPGDDWDSRIREAIRCSRAFVACLSSNSLTKDGYFQRELRTALSRMEEKPSGTIFFVPALLEPVNVPDLKVGSVSINHYHYARLYEPRGFDLLLLTLKQATSLAPKEQTLNEPPTKIAVMMTKRELIFSEHDISPTDLSDNRFALEVRLLEQSFPAFAPKWNGSRLEYVEGDLKTSYDTAYTVRLEVPYGYPEIPPRIVLSYRQELAGCPYMYADGSISVMNLNQWSSNLSMAFMVAKAAIWLQKFEVWRRTGYWPGERI